MMITLLICRMTNKTTMIAHWNQLLHHLHSLSHSHSLLLSLLLQLNLPLPPPPPHHPPPHPAASVRVHRVVSVRRVILLNRSSPSVNIFAVVNAGLRGSMKIKINRLITGVGWVWEKKRGINIIKCARISIHTLTCIVLVCFASSSLCHVVCLSVDPCVVLVIMRPLLWSHCSHSPSPHPIPSHSISSNSVSRVSLLNQSGGFASRLIMSTVLIHSNTTMDCAMPSYGLFRFEAGRDGGKGGGKGQFSMSLHRLWACTCTAFSMLNNSSYTTLSSSLHICAIVFSLCPTIWMWIWWHESIVPSILL